MKLCVVTSVYNLRKTRPLNYYLVPAIDFLQDMLNSEVHICLFTDQNADLFPKAQNISVFNASPEELIREVWDSATWKQDYVNALEDRAKIRFEKFEQRFVPNLLGIWLGKMSMMSIGANFGDYVLWQDSAIRMPKIFLKSFANYRKCNLEPETYISFTKNILSKYPLAFMKDKYVHLHHGVDMRKYETANKKDQIMAGFIFAQSAEVPLLQENIKQKWSILIGNNDYGTEENAMTLYQWEREDSLVLSYDEWINYLGMGSRIITTL